jgi:hypothetical protein
MYNRDMSKTQTVVKTMLLSEMVKGVDYAEKVGPSALPIPNSDSVQYVTSPESLKIFIETYGDHEVKINHDSPWYSRYTIADFDASRKAYCDAKQAWCDRYGCE